MLIVDSAYSPSIPKTILKDNEVKMSKRLTTVRECLIDAYISSWWMYISPNKDFEKLTRRKITRILELLVERFKNLNYSQLIMIVIRLKVGMSKYKHGNSLKKMSEIDQEKYFSSVIHEILPKLLTDEEDMEIDELRKFLSDLISVSVLVPLLDLVQTPVIIFNSIIALLAKNVDDIGEYVEQVRKLRNKTIIQPVDEKTFPEFVIQNPTIDFNVPPINSSSLCSVANTMVYSNSSADLLIENKCSPVVALTTYDNKQAPFATSSSHAPTATTITTISTPANVLLEPACLNQDSGTIENISIIDTFKSTDKAGSSSTQYTKYVIEFDHIIKNCHNGVKKYRKTILRRYREFISLHNIISDHSDSKGIKGPSNFDQMLMYNRSPAKIYNRREFLENYLRIIISRKSLANLPVLHNFLGVGKTTFEPSKPFNEKLRKRFNVIMDKISDKFPDISRDGSHDDLKRLQREDSPSSSASFSNVQAKTVNDTNTQFLSITQCNKCNKSINNPERSIVTNGVGGSGAIAPHNSNSTSSNNSNRNTGEHQTLMDHNNVEFTLTNNDGSNGSNNNNINPARDQTNSNVEEVNKILTSLPKLNCHQNPAFPTVIPQFDSSNPLVQANYPHITDNYLPLISPSSICHQHNHDDRKIPVKYETAPFLYLPGMTIQPFLLSFRILALQYRDHTCRNWSSTQGPVLTRTAGFHGIWEKLYWRVLGCAADPIIQWSFEDLLRASYVADYLELFQNLLWPPLDKTKNTKSLATFAYDVDIKLLRQAASQSIVDAIPTLAYLFVDKEELADLIDTVLSDFQTPQNNRLFLFQLLQILIEEHLFRDVFSGVAK